MARLAFIGLGTMGGPMAGHLADAGHQVTVYNRSQDKVHDWLSKHPACQHAATPKLAATNAEFVFTCVGNDNDLREVTLGENGVIHGLQPGAILVDHTTASASIARELHALCKQSGNGFLDAPVSGGEAGAVNGQLSIMVGGNDSDFEKITPIVKPYTKAIELIGTAGSGQLTKMVNQICVAGLLQGLSEGLHFGESAGLDMGQVLKVISAGAAGSWQMTNRAETMLKDEFDFGFAIDWMRKDLDICLEESQSNSADLPITSSIYDRYIQLQEMGGGRWDTSALIKLLKATPE